MKRRSCFQYYILFLLMLSLVSCEIKRPRGVLSDSEMENVLYDYHIAKSMADQLPYTENYKRTLYIDAALKKHGLTQADFNTSMEWFSGNPDVLSQIYENLCTRLKTQKGKLDHMLALRNNAPKESLPGDSVNIWAWQKIYRLTGSPFNNKVSFVFPADANFQVRDIFHWNVRFRFPKGNPDPAHAPVMVMQIVLQNDSLINDSRRIYNAGGQKITLRSDSIHSVKEVKGFIYYPAGSLDKIILVDRISLMRHHFRVIAKPVIVSHVDTVHNVKKDTMPAQKPINQSVPTGAPTTIPAQKMTPQERERIRAVPKRQIQRTIAPALQPVQQPAK